MVSHSQNTYEKYLTKQIFIVTARFGLHFKYFNIWYAVVYNLDCMKLDYTRTF